MDSPIAHAAFPPNAHEWNITQLNVSRNAITSLPPALLQRPGLGALDATHNLMTGTLPATIDSPLALLALGHNLLSGTIPVALTNKSTLHSLFLESNAFTGTLPSAWGAKVRNVFAGNNRLTGGVPPALARLPMAQNLDLTDNLLTGTLPPLWNASYAYVALANNSLVGPIPRPLLEMESLQVLLLGENAFTGAVASVPTGLRVLDVSGNYLRGDLPTLGPNLTVVSVSRNLLWGSLAFETGVVSLQLRNISASLNRLSGTLPSVDMPNASSHSVDVLTGNLWDCPPPTDRPWTLDAHLDTFVCAGWRADDAAYVVLGLGAAVFASSLRSTSAAGSSLAPGTRPRVPMGPEHAVYKAALGASVVWTATFGLTCVAAAAVYVWAPSTVRERPGVLAATAAFIGDQVHTGFAWLVVVTLLVPPLTLVGWWYAHRTHRRRTLRAHAGALAAGGQDPGAGAGAGKRAHVATRALVVAVAVLVCASPNALYVGVERYLSANSKQAVKASVALVKAALNTALLRFAASYATGTGSSKHTADAHLRLTAVLQHVNTVIIPAAATLILHPSCVSALYTVPNTPLEVPVQQCVQWTTTCQYADMRNNPLPCGTECAWQPDGHCIATCNTNQGDLGYAPVSRNVTVAHPWRWNTACPSALIELYGQVYVLSLLLQGVLWNGILLHRVSERGVAAGQRVYHKVARIYSVLEARIQSVKTQEVRAEDEEQGATTSGFQHGLN